MKLDQVSLPKDGQWDDCDEAVIVDHVTGVQWELVECGHCVWMDL